MQHDYDILIIGTGMGGGTLAYALRNSGMRILLLERGDYLPHEPYIAELAERLCKQGLHPYHMPMGVDRRPGGRCIRCKTCDGFPCQVFAKNEADVCGVRPALESPTVELWTNTYARRLFTEPTGRHVTTVEVERGGLIFEVHAET